MTARTLCTFSLDGLQLGIDVAQVREVLADQTVTRVPCAPRSVSGLLNLRGQIVTVIDGRHRLGLPDRPSAEDPGRPRPTAGSVHLILQSAGEQVSLTVDSVGEVVEVGPEAYEDVPTTIDGPIRPFLTGTYKLGDTLLLMVDADLVTAVVGGR